MKHSIDINRVIDVFRSISKAEEIDERAAVFCHSAKETIERQLKVNCDIATNQGRLSYAAGALAFYRYVLSEAANMSASFSAGDLKIASDKNSIEAAKNMYIQSYNAISDLLLERSFSFRSI